MYKNMNEDLGTLTDWFCANKLSVNASKTKYIVFSKENLPYKCDYNLFIMQKQLERVSNVKFLGLVIDEKLKWDKHIGCIKNKVSSGVYAMNITKRFLSTDHLKILYYSLIHPHILYGLRLWGTSYQKLTKGIVTLQKKAIRILSNAHYNDHSSPLFKNAKVLKFHDLCYLDILKFMYSFVNNLLPEPLLFIFEFQRNVHGHLTRHRDDPRPLKAQSDLLSRSFLCKGPTEWMALDDDCKSAISKSSFQNKVLKVKLSAY